ncbi:hypothetical protein KFE25_013790 [Diacronema lutheri]|uniref:Thiamine phosphate synthase/TenI domain-containing protein n=1 Tax=Diacronema lutheri TaxID=2081491 RepID=A0A8J5XUM5_DIALT|nr:hypothetical protein KFE25_013790 [Diacronema lutheri]
MAVGREFARQLCALSAESAFGGQRLPELIVLTDEARQGPFASVVEHLSAPPRCWVVFRDYAMPPAARLEAATRARDLCAARGITFLLARDAELAQRIGADGVHLPQPLLPRLAQWRHAHPDFVWSAACHDGESLRTAATLGATIALVSPIFATRSHPGASAMGTERLATLVRSQPRMPVYAMGGVGSASIAQLALARTGVAGIAGIDLVADLLTSAGGERAPECG